MLSVHSHSGQFCRHASGKLEDCVLKAIEKGFEVFGLSEHMPRDHLQDLYPEEQDMVVQDLFIAFDLFIIEAQRLKLKYKDKIKIFIGMETEFVTSNSLSTAETLIQKYPIEYLVGSVHHVNGIWIDFDQENYQKALQSCGSLDNLYSAYFDAQYEMLCRLKPAVIGHFDLIRLFSPTHPVDNVLSKICRNIDFINSYGGLVEINSRAFKKNLKGPYPLEPILSLMIEKKCRFTLSDDSHAPNEVGLFYEETVAFIKDRGITQLYFADFQFAM